MSQRQLKRRIKVNLGEIMLGGVTDRVADSSNPGVRRVRGGGVKRRFD